MKILLRDQFLTKVLLGKGVFICLEGKDTQYGSLNNFLFIC